MMMEPERSAHQEALKNREAEVLVDSPANLPR
jgi:hypothetical protein